MFDQTFSAENFRIIFDSENRKGNYLEGRFFPKIKMLTTKIKSLKTAGTVVNALIEQRDSLLDQQFEKLSEMATRNKFSFRLHKVNAGKGMIAYTYNISAPSYFILKQIQKNLRTIYKVEQGNQYSIACQLREILSDRLPKHIIRTDISRFYESISTKRLMKKLNDDNLLAHSSKSVIHNILCKYNIISNSEIGLPRGISICADLAEIYMKKFDEIMLNERSTIYYTRYVDDIVIVSNAESGHDSKCKLNNIEKHATKIDLSLNKKKTEITTMGLGSKARPLDYLGYQFSFEKTCTNLSLSQSKVKKYTKRIDQSFCEYHRLKGYNCRKAKSLLIKRTKFLTGNTRLVNRKKDVVVGIFFSNSLINEYSCLEKLDAHLEKKIKDIHDVKLNKALRNLSFSKNFFQRRFFSFSASELKSIVGIWKHGK